MFSSCFPTTFTPVSIFNGDNVTSFSTAAGNLIDKITQCVKELLTCCDRPRKPTEQPTTLTVEALATPLEVEDRSAKQEEIPTEQPTTLTVDAFASVFADPLELEDAYAKEEAMQVQKNLQNLLDKTKVKCKKLRKLVEEMQKKASSETTEALTNLNKLLTSSEEKCTKLEMLIQAIDISSVAEKQMMDDSFVEVCDL